MHQNTAGFVKDFQWTTCAGRHHRQACLHRFDKGDPERLCTEVRLTINVSGQQQLVYIRTPPQEAYTLHETEVGGKRTQSLLVHGLFGPLWTTCYPANPLRDNS